jgi:hypothetical protein
VFKFSELFSYYLLIIYLFVYSLMSATIWKAISISKILRFSLTFRFRIVSAGKPANIKLT